MNHKAQLTTFEATSAGVLRRFEAFASHEGSPASGSDLPDPFPDFRGVPEVEPAALNSAMIGGAVRHHGCLLVRGLFSGESLERLQAAVRSALEAGGRFFATKEVNDWFAPFPLLPDTLKPAARRFSFDGGSVWAPDSPAALAVLLDEFLRAGVVDAIEGYLGEPAYLSVGKTSLRRVDPNIPTAWHQDGAFLGEHIRTVNCWVALSDCGEDSPGLDLLPFRVDQLCATGTHGTPFDWSIGDTVVEDLAREVGAPIVSPSFSAGDALLFDQLFVHRTGIQPGMTKPRYAIEAWHFAGSTFPSRQIPIAIR
jgi:hypothetical protein